MNRFSSVRLPSLVRLLTVGFGILFTGCTLACASNTAPSVSSASLAPDAPTVARARAVGLPAVDASGRVAGPFAGPEGTLYYVGNGDRILFFHPDRLVAYFGRVTPTGITYAYALTLQGQFRVDATNTMRQVQVLPDDALQWPHAEAVAQVLMGRLRQIQAGQMAAPTTQDVSPQAMQSQALHDTTQAILDNMGNTGCTEHYDDVFYLGCW